jgi:hypothetical protein
MSDKIKYVFVDLDECLISANYRMGNVPRDMQIIRLDDGAYCGRLRPGAKALLAKLRAKYPTFMLTAATGDYAKGWNDVFELGFKETDIYSREDTYGGTIHKPMGQCYLIDNLPETAINSEDKIKFLSSIGPVMYIQIKAYNGNANQALSEEYINSILDDIINS